jgi:SM-20-related protein
VVPGFVKSEALSGIHKDYPRIAQPGSFPVEGLSCGPAFASLLEELRGPAMRAAFEKKFELDLAGRPMMVTVRGQSSTRDGNIHTDAASKIITILIYMNPRWEQGGGRLRLLRSANDIDDVLVEIPPIEGTLVAFRRSDNSYHGHKPFIGPRRVIQVNWVTDRGTRNREIWRHRVSAWLKRGLGFFRREPAEYSARN